MKPNRRFPLVLLFPLGLASCAQPSNPALKPLALPEAWKNAGSFPVASVSSDLSRWWRRFDDSVLNDLISGALEANPDLEAATANVSESRARRSAEAATLFPTLNGSASSSSRRTKSDQTGTLSATSYSAGLDASWEVDLFGKRRSVVAAATANMGAAEESLHSVHAALAAEIATTYTSLRANEARLIILRQTVITREQTAQLATWRQQAGEADSLEASQALSSLESARAGIPSLEQAIAEAHNLLSLLAGRLPGSLDSILSAGGPIPNPPASLAVGIPVDALRQRPDVRLAGYQVLAAAANRHAADAARYPSLNLYGTLDINAATLRNLFDPETVGANFAANIASPIFDAGRIRSEIEAATAAENQAIAVYRNTVLTALSEAENALIACRRSAQRLGSLEEATRLAREADTLARQRYQSGEIDFLDVLDSQRTLLGLEDNLLTTRTDRTTAYIRLYQALGGGWGAAS